MKTKPELILPAGDPEKAQSHQLQQNRPNGIFEIKKALPRNVTHEKKDQ